MVRTSSVACASECSCAATRDAIAARRASCARDNANEYSTAGKQACRALRATNVPVTGSLSEAANCHIASRRIALAGPRCGGALCGCPRAWLRPARRRTVTQSDVSTYQTSLAVSTPPPQHAHPSRAARTRVHKPDSHHSLHVLQVASDGRVWQQRVVRQATLRGSG